MGSSLGLRAINKLEGSDFVNNLKRASELSEIEAKALYKNNSPLQVAMREFVYDNLVGNTIASWDFPTEEEWENIISNSASEIYKDRILTSEDIIVDINTWEIYFKEDVEWNILNKI